jgi:hypothetical protein
MWTVGDEVTHQKFLAALTKSHGYDGRVEAWYNGEKIDEVDFATGSVKVTANRERRSLTLTVAERLWPTLPTDPTSPFGVWLQAFVTVTAGATRFPEIPVFAGRLSKVSRIRWSGQLQVEAVDPMWQVNREVFEVPRYVGDGNLIIDVARALLLEVYEQATLQDLTGSAAMMPVAATWDTVPGARGKALDELAAALGAEVFARPTAVWPGGDFVIRPVPSPTDPVAWTLPDGAASIVAGDEQALSGLAVANRWIVTSERTDEVEPIRVVVSDDAPASTTRYGGPMGKLTDFYTSALITSHAQAFMAGQAKLIRSLGPARTRAVRLVANPALDAGDVLAVSVDGERVEFHVVDDFDIPLTHDPADMTVTTQSTGAGDEG